MTSFWYLHIKVGADLTYCSGLSILASEQLNVSCLVYTFRSSDPNKILNPYSEARKVKNSKFLKHQNIR